MTNVELFVGRSSELAVVRDLLTAVRAGVGGAVLVEGEQGIGKSALLRTGLAEAGECRVGWGAADVLGQQFPLRLMAECLGAGDTVGDLAAAAAEAAERPGGMMSGVTGFSGDPVLAGMEGLLALADRLCSAGPLVLVAEDLQWADETSLVVWRQLCRAVGQLPLLVAGSCRPGTGAVLRREVLAAGGRLVELRPLGGDEVAELIGHLAGGSPGPGLARLVARAGGNPLYARQLADALVRADRIRVAGGVAELAGEPGGVPASLAAVIAERLDALAPETLSVLRWAAILGLEFSVADLGTVTGRSAGELMGVVDEAVMAQIVMEAGRRLRFGHGLIREVLHEGMPVALRAALHQQAARALAGAGAQPERVAAQLIAAGQDGGVMTDTAQAWVPGWLAEGVPTLIYSAPQVAAELLRGVLAQLADADPGRAVLEAALVTAAFLLVEEDEVERVGGRALAREGDPDQAAEVAWLVGYSLLRTGRADDAAGVAVAALGRPGIGEAQAARMRALHAMILISLGEWDRAGEVARQALADAERAGDRFASGYAMNALSNLQDEAGRLGQIDRALDVIGDDPQTTDLRLLLLFNRASALDSLDRQGEAIATAGQALVLAERAGTPRLGMIRYTRADQCFEAGRWDDALIELEPATSLPGPNQAQILAHGLFALIAGHRGDRDTADKHLRAAPDQELHDATSLANAHYLLLARALLAERAGRPAEAAAVLALCLQPGIVYDRYLLLPTLIRLAQATGDVATAQAAAQAAAREAEREALPRKTAAADYCGGLLAGDPDPVLAVARYYEAAGRPWYRAEALEDAAVLAARRGDQLAARRMLTTAIGLYALVGAGWDIRRAGARLRPYGVRRGGSPARPRPTSGWEALTPTEAKIAWRVAAGGSNPDIAAELFLSRNTVQTHVSHILAKLGARSRAEIIREALRHPAADQPAPA